MTSQFDLVWQVIWSQKCDCLLWGSFSPLWFMTLEKIVKWWKSRSESCDFTIFFSIFLSEKKCKMTKFYNWMLRFHEKILDLNFWQEKLHKWKYAKNLKTYCVHNRFSERSQLTNKQQLWSLENTRVLPQWVSLIWIS